MKLEIRSKYLVFPVNTMSTGKDLIFKRNGETVYQLYIKLDNLNPDFNAYIDVSRFVGQTIDISVTPEMRLEFREADEMDIQNLYNEPIRPHVHFTTKNGWINDPNGLIYLDGVYHMFYQHNPAEPNWNNMHWGHAESRDLIHWEEKDIALFPDERGAMFSGSAILDDKNLLGKNSGNNKAALLFYTTYPSYCQYMSYSIDNFKTINRYGKKPVVAPIKTLNRDPKVVFCDELGCYIMALYLEEDIMCILKSDDLVNWKEWQHIRLEEDGECPDIFPLCDSQGNRKWILIGAHEKYLVGRFEEGKFVAEQSVLPLGYGSMGYAGQSFSNLPGGRVVRMVWDMWSWGLPPANFKGQMGIPMEMSLYKFEDTYYLQANPVQEIKNIYKNTVYRNHVTVGTENVFREALEETAQLIKLKSNFFENAELILHIFGRRICLNFTKNEMTIGGCTAPISLTHNNLDLTIIVDRCSMELFADGGKITMSCLDNNAFSDFNLPYITIQSDKNIILESIEINSLHSIWIM